MLLLPVIACAQADRPQGPAAASPQPASTPNVVRVETVASGLEHPWGLAFLPDGRMLVTERPGRLRLVARDGTLSAPLGGVPTVAAEGQGGLLDITLDPDFARSRVLYLSFSEPGADGKTNSTAVVRATLNATATALEQIRVIYRQLPKIANGYHFGSRIVVAPDSTLFITQGERFSERAQAQQLSSGLGKVVRIHRDGRIPDDNPFVKTPGAFAAIWSLGHRNMQGAAIDPATGRLWTVEHGPMGGDELNHPEAGKNYGWPEIGYGRHYDGSRVGSGAVRAGMEQPVYYWDPVIAPSGLTFYTGDRYPDWRGDLFIGSMTPGGLVRLRLRDGRVVREERYLGELRERIRDVVQGPDGYLYLLTDSGMGRVLRVLPVTPSGAATPPSAP